MCHHMPRTRRAKHQILAPLGAGRSDAVAMVAVAAAQHHAAVQIDQIGLARRHLAGRTWLGAPGMPDMTGSRVLAAHAYVGGVDDVAALAAAAAPRTQPVALAEADQLDNAPRRAASIARGLHRGAGRPVI